jgi:hypothetical protein
MALGPYKYWLAGITTARDPASAARPVAAHAASTRSAAVGRDLDETTPMVHGYTVDLTSNDKEKGYFRELYCP